MLKSSIKIVKEKFRIISLIFLFFCAPFIHEIDAAPTSWTVDYLNNPAPGYVRIEMSYFMLFDNYGSRRFIDSSGVGVNSQYALLKNGNTLESATNKMYVRNNNNIRIDSIPYTTGLDLDFHDVIVLNNGHYLILYYEYYTKDMSQIVQGGHVNANVMANVLVETDRTGSVFWMWHARDHYNITDVTEDIDLSQENIDFTHINSMYEDIDGNILVSVRHLDEVSKINKSTGAFMYRIGGTTCANNEFQFTNDTRDNFQGFSHQHSISLLSNGNLLMFDNGNMKPQPYSRAVEYSINATNKTAEKVWEYINPSSNLTAAMGSVSRLPNGNTIVNWSDRITEVRPDLTKTFEMFSTDNSLIYKAFRVTDKIADVTKLINANGYYDFNETNENTGVKIQMTSIAGSSKTSVEKHSYAPPEAGFLDTSFTGLLPYRWVVSNAGLTHIEGKIFINLSGLTGIKSGSKLAIYFRDRESKGIFTELPTTFSQTANDITANITGFGEFCIGTKVLGTQTVIYPKNNQYSLPKSFTYKWDKLQSAKYYQIQISNNSAFTDLVQNQTNLLKNEFTYDGHLENKDYYWRVRAINQVDTSAWSQTTLFHTVLPKPQLIFPINNENAFDKEDSIKWVVSDKLSNNWLQVSKDQEFLDLAINNTKAGTSFDASRYLLNNTKYYWRVRSYRTSDTSNWSDINTFKTNFERPKLVLPVNDSINVVNSGMIKWNFVQGASKYHVQISNDSLFTSIITQNDKIINTFFVFNNLEFDKTIYWRVKVNNNVEDDNWSKPNKFTTVLEKPITLEPTYGQNVFAMNIKMNWKPCLNTKNYLIQFSLKQDFSENLLTLNNITSTTIVVPELPAYSTVYWRVKAQNGVKESDWSFTGLINTDNIVAVATPKLIAPENNSEHNIFGTFQWQKSNRALSYRLQLSKSGDFTNLLTDEIINNQNSFDFKDLVGVTTYYWRVKSYSQFDSSSWSSTYSFYTSKFTKIDLIAPINEQLQVSVNIPFNWVNVPNINRYILQYSVDKTFATSVTEINDISTNIANVTQLKSFTKYFWRVKYKIGSEESSWFEIWNFTTASSVVLDKPILTKPFDKEAGIPVEGNFDWNAVKDAEQYNILISKKNSFIEPQIHGSNLLIHEFNYSGLENNAIYYTKVSAKNKVAGSFWSEISEFLTELPKPENLIPENRATNVPLQTQFYWDDINSTERYIIQISEDSTFANNVITNESLLPYCNYTLNPNTIYYWRVKALNSGNFSNWSYVSSFSTGLYNSVEDNASNENYIYPNPAKDNILINEVNTNLDYSIINVNGMQVKSGRLTENRINISELNQGIFLIHINGKIYKLIKI